MNPMRLRNATLIQKGFEWFSYFESELNKVLSKPEFSGQQINMDELIAWIAREQIEKIFGMIVTNHCKNDTYAAVYGKLRNEIAIDMDVIFTHYFRIPRLYGDSPIDVYFTSTDLVIEYYLENLKPHPLPIQ